MPNSTRGQSVYRRLGSGWQIMTTIPIIVLEDQELVQSEKTATGLSLQKAGFEFDWHGSSTARIVSREVRERFEKFLTGLRDGGWGTLPSPAIVLMDLGYDVGLSPSEDQELSTWLGGSYYGSAGQRDGFYL